MKKSYKLQNLDCANCAAKMEAAVGKMDGVEDCSISFMAQKMTIEADEAAFETIIDEAQKVIKKVDRDCKIIK